MKNGTPELMHDLAIVKRYISVKDAAAVGENDIEVMALRQRKQPGLNSTSTP